MSITPLGDRVFVKRHEPKQKTSGGILLPDSAQKKLNLAEIVAVGGVLRTRMEKLPHFL